MKTSVTDVRAWIARHGWFVLVAAAAMATAFYRLGGRGLWGDEVWDALWSRQQSPWQTFLRFRQPPDFPLQFLLTQLTTGPRPCCCCTPWGAGNSIGRPA
jgi:hypothetical protein